jgi:hypothetical protein
MKKIIITFALVFLAIISQAQNFFGGNLTANFQSDTYIPKTGPEIKGDSYFDFTIAPMTGRQLNKKLAVGTRLSYTLSKDIEQDDGEWITTKQIGGVELFIRHTFAEFGRFSVLAEAGLSLGLGNEKLTRNDYIYIDEKISIYGLNIRPILSYNLSEKINLEAGLNFLNLGLAMRISKDKDTGDERVKPIFDLVLNSYNVTTTSGVISIGFTRKFGTKNKKASTTF